MEQAQAAGAKFLAPPAEQTSERTGVHFSGLLHWLAEGRLPGEYPRDALKNIRGAQASNLREYALSRVERWARVQHRIDSRFTPLTLLLYQDERSGYQPSAKRRDEPFTDLATALEDAADYPALVLLGSPGSGKSTLLQRLELDICRSRAERGEGQLTAWFTLRDHKSGSPAEWLAGQWCRLYPQLPPLKDILASGQLLLLLDGLNELPHRDADHYRERLDDWADWLRELADLHSGNRAIFSCRLLDYSGGLAVPHLRIEPLGDEQMEDFLHCYLPDDCADGVWRQLQGSEQRKLYRTPYFLDLLCRQVHSDDGQLPEGRAELFTGFVREAILREREQRGDWAGELLDRREVEKLLNPTRRPPPHWLPQRGPLFPQLAALAHRMQDSGLDGEPQRVAVDREQVEDWLEAATPGKAEMLIDAGCALAVFDDDALNEWQPRLRYRHQLLQEYFAARQLAQQPEPQRVMSEWRAELIRPALDDLLASIADYEPLPGPPTTGWEETARLAAAMAESPQQFIIDLAECNLPLAGECALLSEVKTQLDDAFVEQLRQQLLDRSRDPQADLRARIAAGFALGDLGDPRLTRHNGPHGDYLLPQTARIEAGRYPLGSEDGEPDERDGGTVTLEAFELAVLPVTNAEYRMFVDAKGYTDSRWWQGEEAQAWWQGKTAEGPRQSLRDHWRWLNAKPGRVDLLSRERKWDSKIEQANREFAALREGDELEADLAKRFSDDEIREPMFLGNSRYNRAAQPVVGVCWYEAQAYCAWLSAQSGRSWSLPSEAQWEAAARGRDGLIYPWGPDFDAARANIVETHIRGTTPVGVFPGGDTPQTGLVDMAGNVWEWTSSGYQDYPYCADDRESPAGDGRRVLRGGSWNSTSNYARSACRYYSHLANRRNSSGFRLLFTPHPVKS